MPDIKTEENYTIEAVYSELNGKGTVTVDFKNIEDGSIYRLICQSGMLVKIDFKWDGISSAGTAIIPIP